MDSRPPAIGRARWIGFALVAVGIVHTIFGIAVMSSTLRVIAGEGFFYTVHGQPEREAVFWFLYSGFALMIMGGLVDWIESHGLALPRFFPWAFLAMTSVGAFLMPASGFWLLFPPIVGMFLRQKTNRRTEAAARTTT
jgi:hypothetical protein